MNRPSLTLVKRIEFEAWHTVPGMPDGDKDHLPHAHDYAFEAAVRGVPDGNGMVMDAGELKAFMLLATADVRASTHLKTINHIPDLTSGTVEDLVLTLWGRLAPHVPDLYRLTVWESPRTYAIAEAA
jgi:6-pyruvoyl-tetrahydropterin synthase